MASPGSLLPGLRATRVAIVRVDLPGGARAATGRRPGRACTRAPKRDVGRGKKYKKKYDQKAQAAKADKGV